MKSPHLDWPAFGRAFDQTLKARDVRAAALVEKLCISKAQLSKLRKGERIEAGCMITVADWMGVDPRLFLLPGEPDTVRAAPSGRGSLSLASIRQRVEADLSAKAEVRP